MNNITTGELRALLSKIPEETKITSVFHEAGYDMNTKGRIASVELSYTGKYVELILHIHEIEQAIAA